MADQILEIRIKDTNNNIQRLINAVNGFYPNWKIAHADIVTKYDISAINQINKTFTISGEGDLSFTYPIGSKITVINSNSNDGDYNIVGINYNDPNFTITVDENIPSSGIEGKIHKKINLKYFGEYLIKKNYLIPLVKKWESSQEKRIAKQNIDNLSDLEVY